MLVGSDHRIVILVSIFVITPLLTAVQIQYAFDVSDSSFDCVLSKNLLLFATKVEINTSLFKKFALAS